MESYLEAKIKRFTPVVITADTAGLSAGDRAALRKLIEAAKLMDSIYIRQVWNGNEELLRQLESDSSAAGKEQLKYFLMNMGPWAKIDRDSAFIAGVPPRPPQATYYPDDMSKQEFQSWVAKLPQSEREKATGDFYVIRRDSSKGLYAVPYSTEYRQWLHPAAALLREAAGLTDNPTLKDFLNKRADAFLSNDYYDSDVAWMKLDSPLDVTIGPYENYMDGLFNYKAAFEAFVGLRDNEESAKLERFSKYLQEIENHLPVDPAYRNPKLGLLAPVRVIDEVVTGGEPRAGVQTAAYNLPNNDRIVKEMGSKRVMLKNVQEAKFNSVLKPIAAVVLDPSQRSQVAFDPFFTHILAHELMHGLGPHNITVDGRSTTARAELKELFSAFEEAKADVSGLFALQFLIDAGVVDKAMEQPMYVTFLASAFRSLRFGPEDAHGKGMALQFNYLSDEGAFAYDQGTGTYHVDFTKVKDAVRKLTGAIMTLQAKGDYEGTMQMLDRYAVVNAQMRKVLDKLTGIPVDIAPEYPLGK